MDLNNLYTGECKGFLIFTLLVQDEEFIINNSDIAHRIFDSIFKAMKIVKKESRIHSETKLTFNNLLMEYYFKNNRDCVDIELKYNYLDLDGVYAQIHRLNKCTAHIFEYVKEDIDAYLEFKEREELRLLDELLEEYK